MVFCAVAGCTGAATSARSRRRSSARHSCSSPTTIAWRPPAFAWRTGTATADQTSSPAASSETRRAAPAPGTRRCGSTFAAVAENADFAGPNQALHLTRPASALLGVHCSLMRAGQVSSGVRRQRSAAMANIERQYEYKPRWSHVLLVGGFCILLAASAIARASPENLGVMYWIVLVVCLAGVVVSGVAAVDRLFF